MGRTAVQSDFEGYLRGLLPEREAPLMEMEKEAEEAGFPIIGPQVGRLLSLLVRALGARHVFELGSGFGYSAYWMARAMGEGGKIECTEAEERNAQWARDAFARAGMSERLTFHVGNACEIFARTEGPFDLILLDLDKWEYPRALDLALPRLRKGGFLVSDNLLWGGAVLDAPDPEDRDTAGILEFTRRITTDPGLFSTVIPIRDGVGLTQKL